MVGIRQRFLKWFSVASFISIILLLFISAHRVEAQVTPPPPLPPQDCPTPANSCAAACGTYCKYWTCNNPATTPEFEVNSLPYRWVWWQENACTGRVGKQENLNELKKTYTFGPAGKTQTITLDTIPYKIKLQTWACLENGQSYGGCCAWAWNPPSACTAVCGYNTVTGTQTSTSRCDAPNGDCCGPKPGPKVTACSINCPAPPAPKIISIETYPDWRCKPMSVPFESFCDFVITFDQPFDSMNLALININDDSLTALYGGPNPIPIGARYKIGTNQVVLDTDNAWCGKDGGGLCNNHWYTVNVPAGTVSFKGTPSIKASRQGLVDKY